MMRLTKAVLEIDADEFEPMESYTGGTRFQPDMAKIEVFGDWTRVEVSGPRLTKGGTHASQRSSWLCIPNSLAPWPPAACAALQLFTNLLNEAAVSAEEQRQTDDTEQV
jgi:hypothetical protein